MTASARLILDCCEGVMAAPTVDGPLHVGQFAEEWDFCVAFPEFLIEVLTVV